MNGLIKALFVFAVVANGRAKKSSITDYAKTEYFIRHIETLQYFDQQIQKFQQNSAVRLETINLKLDMLLQSLLQTEENFKQLKVLSNLSRTCVRKHSKSIQSIGSTKRRINQCINAYKESINMTVPMNIKNDLKNYYDNIFEKEFENCALSTRTANKHSDCVTDTIIRATHYSTNCNKTFNEEMETLLNKRVVNVKEALTCSYKIEIEVIAYIAQANILINKCMLAQYNFLKNNKVHTCSEQVQMKYSDVCPGSQVIRNPFYKRHNVTTCIMVQLV